MANTSSVSMAMHNIDPNPDIQYEVDIMTLDYFCYRTIQVILRSRRAELQDKSLGIDVEAHLSLFSTFKQLVTNKYGYQHVTGDLQTKLQLLTVANLLFFRHRTSIWAQRRSHEADAFSDHELERIHKLRGNIWPSEAWSLAPPNFTELENTFLDGLSQLKIPRGQACSRQDVTSLLNILPDFMALCARTTPLIALERSMEVAAQFMMFASLEQYLIFGQTSSYIYAQAFGWDFPDKTPPNDASINGSKFLWRQKRDEYIKLLLPKDGIPIETQYRNLWTNPSPYQFEKNVLDYLILILTRVEVPVLTQVEVERLSPRGDRLESRNT